MGAYPRLFKLSSKGGHLRLVAGIAAAGVAVAAGADLIAADSLISSSGGKIASALDGVARSSRAIYTIGFIVVDYKYSLRSLPPDSSVYRIKLSEVHSRSAKKLLKLCEANRGFYVKAGQFVSSLRQVPKEYSSTLSSLQDQATPYHFKDIKGVIEQNLRKDLSDLFLEFDEQPIAAASIAQVHRGLLKDKQEVAIKVGIIDQHVVNTFGKRVVGIQLSLPISGKWKQESQLSEVQYPGLEQRMKMDILTMSILSKSVSWIFPDYRFERMLSEFERAMSFELDFVQEAKNSERTARNFRKNYDIKIPLIFWDLTTSQVLTMQYCEGHKVDDLNFLRNAGINPAKVAKALMDLFAEMIFVHGFLHGDPHPGNILVSPKGRNGFSLVLLDHGIYRELDEKFRLDYCQLWKALVLLDSQKILQLGEQFGVGKYSKYFPVIFTGRTIESKSILGTQMSDEEKRRFKRELHSLRMEDISSFMESLPPDFLTILRTDGLLRSIVGKLGAPRHVRLLAYAKYAIYGLEKKSDLESDTVKHALSKFRANMGYFQLMVLLEFMALLSQMNNLRRTLAVKLKRILHGLVNFLYIDFIF